MLNHQAFRAHLPDELYRHIVELRETFQDIQSDIGAVKSDGGTPQAQAQLQDVMRSTEEATMTILDAVGAMAASPDPETLEKQTAIIYEACNFQDITSQRIKKVLSKLEQLDGLVARLAESADIYAGQAMTPATQKSEAETLMEGPQLLQDAPDQDEIDRLFNSPN